MKSVGHVATLGGRTVSHDPMTYGFLALSEECSDMGVDIRDLFGRLVVVGVADLFDWGWRNASWNLGQGRAVKTSEMNFFPDVDLDTGLLSFCACMNGPSA